MGAENWETEEDVMDRTRQNRTEQKRAWWIGQDRGRQDRTEKDRKGAPRTSTGSIVQFNGKSALTELALLEFGAGASCVRSTGSPTKRRPDGCSGQGSLSVR